MHHVYQGVKPFDTDIPGDWEADCVRNNLLLKILFIFMIPVTYSMRPAVVHPLKKTAMEAFNFMLILATDALIFYNFGGKGLFYILCGTLMGMCMHPAAGHFLAEHYCWEPESETSSYYGPWNILMYNVGYHVEHHDFPRVPGSRLPALRKIANSGKKEWYPSDKRYQSWPWFLIRFLYDPTMGLYNRVTRPKSAHTEGKKAVMKRYEQTAEPPPN
eukprot:NODE_1574_length_807_cov_90.054412_g1525_i0.p1 GENE.NODE_1574_length_807_cov_90.054412_g1525_i0~~NODE_1574_length_807_cov_90.054412_g1525_i0.p1  ORF type:complete len:239 (+),score=39.07 NODE_1574_length_807_cov_90.054412_g1525_i0:71-718(+)